MVQTRRSSGRSTTARGGREVATASQRPIRSTTKRASRGGRGSRGGRSSRAGPGAKGRGKSRKETAKGTSGNANVGERDGGELVDQDFAEREGDSTEFGNGCDVTEKGLGYFEAHAGAVKTSAFTLNDLHVSGREGMRRAEEKISGELKEERSKLEASHKAMFRKWYYLLGSGFSVLVHGFGSKRRLLEDFAEFVNDVVTDDVQVMVVCGYSPMISIVPILSLIADDILQLRNYSKRTPLDYVDAIRSSMTDQLEEEDARRHTRLVLVVHNIDGPALRSPESQGVLSALAKIPSIHLVASIDHVNAPLLWNSATHAAFCWSWTKCITFQPYDVETAFCTAPVLHRGDEARVQGAVILLRSLTAKARKVFRLMAEPIAAKDGTDDIGPDKRDDKDVEKMTFNGLFDQSRQKFYVSNPADLRSILTELKTHDLLESRVGADAAQLIWLPLTPAQAKAVLKELGTEAQ